MQGFRQERDNTGVSFRKYIWPLHGGGTHKVQTVVLKALAILLWWSWEGTQGPDTGGGVAGI